MAMALAMAIGMNVVPAIAPPRLPFALTRFSVCRPPPMRIRAGIAAAISTSREVQHPPGELTASGKDAAWKDFADRVSGEWDGYGAEFSAAGAPCELPSSVVPEAFREWDVQIHDWQTQCPTLAQESLQYKLIRLLPTVGCEADAATQHSVDERQAADIDSGVEFLAFHASGSYIAVWPGRRVLREMFGHGNPAKRSVHEGNMQSSFEVEHCLVQDKNPRFRVRILQQIALQGQHENGRSVPVLKSITVQREKWEGEYRNGEVLGGCATSGSAFATETPLQAPDVAGTWHFDNFAAESGPHLDGTHQLVSVRSDTEFKEVPESVLLLPKGLWSEMTLLEDGQYLISAGWLVNSDDAITSNCEFLSNGKAKKTVLRFGTRKA